MEANYERKNHQPDDDNSVDAGYSANDKYLENEAGDVTFTNDKSTFSNSDHFDHTNGGASGELEAGGDNGSLYSDEIDNGNGMPDDDLIDDSINFDPNQLQSLSQDDILSDNANE